MKRLSLKDMHAAARRRGGRCLATAYFNAYTPLEWQCARGHRWRAVPHSVRQGHWCKVCAHDKRRDGLHLLSSVASRRGGRCVATSYRNSQTKVEWECGSGHRWSAIPNSVKRGTWCPHCWRGSAA
jgi:hypothetical protein